MVSGLNLVGFVVLEVGLRCVAGACLGVLCGFVMLYWWLWSGGWSGVWVWAHCFAVFPACFVLVWLG